ncbi:MAG: HD-GYP domain-containing protein [Longimicrobiales bacterium]
MASLPTTEETKERWSLLNTRVGRRVFLLFILSALIPLGGMAAVSYRNVAGHIRALTEQRLAETSKAAGMALLERLMAADAQLANRMERGSEVEGRFLANVTTLVPDRDAPRLDSASWARLDAGEPLLEVASEGASSKLHILRLAESGEALFDAELRTDSILAASRIYAQTTFGAGVCVLSGGGHRLGCDAPLRDGFESGALSPSQLSRRGTLEWEVAGEGFIAAYWSAFLRPSFGSGPLTVAVAERVQGLQVPAQAFTSAFLLATALCLLVVLVFSTVLIRRSLAPLAELKTAADRVGESRYEVEVKIDSGDEFQDLGTAFNEMTARIQAQLAQLEELYLGTIRALARAIDASSPWTRGHSERVARVSVAIGAELGLMPDELDLIYRGGLLHDVGKIGVAPEILDKAGPLSEEEWAHIRAHPVVGVNILEPVEQLAPVLPMVRSHHEHLDGAGYPDELAGDEIHPYARIMAVADVWDAITSDRPYRQAMSFDQAWDVICMGSGQQFDPMVVDAFERIARTWYRPRGKNKTVPDVSPQEPALH